MRFVPSVPLRKATLAGCCSKSKDSCTTFSSLISGRDLGSVGSYPTGGALALGS